MSYIIKKHGPCAIAYGPDNRALALKVYQSTSQRDRVYAVVAGEPEPSTEIEPDKALISLLTVSGAIALPR